jgi:RNA polymerase sigma-70 factor (ECF subfamily)
VYSERSAQVEKQAALPEAVSEDAGLVSRIRSGDLGAFELLYRKYSSRLYRTALAITGDRGAAEEILQDTFVRAYAAMRKADGSVSLSPWLHRIVVNLSCNWARRYRQRLLTLDTWLDRLVVPAVSVEHAAESIELGQIVREALTGLGVNQRAVLVLFYVLGFSLSEIACILDCPVGTVKSRLHYACKALRKRLNEDRRLTGEVVYGTS